MKKRVFFQQSGLFIFYVTIPFIVFIAGVAGVVHFVAEIYNGINIWDNIFVLLCCFVGIALMGFELIRSFRQVIILKEESIYVPDEWGISDEKVQYKVELAYADIAYMYLRETTNDSHNKPMKRYFPVTLPKTYLVLCDYNGKEHAVNIVFYTKSVRIKIIDEIIYRMKMYGNESCTKSGKEIYDDFCKR